MDVAGLRSELARLGLVDRAKAAGEPATAELIQQARKLAGLDIFDATPLSLPRAAFAWLPAKVVTISSCDVAVGKMISAGTSLATLAPPVVRAGIGGTPVDALPGPRVFVLEEARLNFVNGQELTPRGLARLLSSDSWATYRQTDGEVPIVGQWQLRAPVDVASVPASTIVTTGGISCVSVSGLPQTVTITASSLGKTLVTFEPTDWPKAIDVTPSSGFSCA